ncbi:unnamed protein product [Chrysoparadoxa australica]
MPRGRDSASAGSSMPAESSRHAGQRPQFSSSSSFFYLISEFWENVLSSLVHDIKFQFQVIFLAALGLIKVLVSFNAGELQEESLEATLSPLTILIVGASFILAFFVNVSYQKYLAQGLLMWDVVGALYDFILLVKGHLHDSPAVQSRLLRYSCAIFYVNVFDLCGYWDWDLLEAEGMLTQMERRKLEGGFATDYNGRAYVLCSWCMSTLVHQFQIIASDEIGPNESRWLSGQFNAMQASVVKVRRSLETLRAERRVLVPKMYSLGLSAVIMTVLTLSALSVVSIFEINRLDAWVLLVGHIIACAVLLGLYNMAVDMLEPFGPHKSDLPIVEWMREMLEGQSTLMLAPIPDENGVIRSPLDSEEASLMHKFGRRWGLGQTRSLTGSISRPLRAQHCCSLDKELAGHLLKALKPNAPLHATPPIITPAQLIHAESAKGGDLRASSVRASSLRGSRHSTGSSRRLREMTGNSMRREFGLLPNGLHSPIEEEEYQMTSPMPLLPQGKTL